MDRFTPSQPPTVIPCFEFRHELFTSVNPQIHGAEDGASGLISRHMLGAGNVVVVRRNAGPIGQHP
jgi:hypothetical protein